MPSSDVGKKMKESSRIFRDYVWPAIRPHIGGGDLHPVESVSAEGFEKLLDVLSGIDAWQVVENRGIRAIASRVQTFSDMRTFTIRLTTRRGCTNTEFEKIRRAVVLSGKGFMAPGLVVQSYTGEDSYAGPCAHIVHASEFYPLINYDNEGRKVRGGRCDGGLWYREHVGNGQTMAVFPISLLKHHCHVLSIPFRMPEKARAAA